MKKNLLYIIVIIIVAAVGGWYGYKYFFDKKSSSFSGQAVSVKSFSSNSCWVYHEYVYRVNFNDQSLRPFLFIRDADGTFSPSKADSSGNHIIGNGFIIDSTGACATTEKISNPWMLSVEEQKPLRALVDAWLEMKEDLVNKDYSITGQTVALFIVLNNPENFIEYTISSPVPGQLGYRLIYPFQKTLFKGIVSSLAFSSNESGSGASVFQVLKTTFDENNSENPVAKTTIDSISAIKNKDGNLSDIKAITGDEFFYEGSAMFDEYGRISGNLHYQEKKWKLISILSFIQNPPTYQTNEPQEEWQYDSNTRVWKRIYVKNSIEKTGDNIITSGEPLTNGSLDPAIKVHPSPTPK
jgi:hypothetical protein